MNTNLKNISKHQISDSSISTLKIGILMLNTKLVPLKFITIQLCDHERFCERKSIAYCVSFVVL